MRVATGSCAAASPSAAEDAPIPPDVRTNDSLCPFLRRLSYKIPAVYLARHVSIEHLRAIEASVREEVVAAITLSEENGRLSVFQNGDYDDYQRAEPGGVWRAGK